MPTKRVGIFRATKSWVCEVRLAGVISHIHTHTHIWSITVHVFTHSRAHTGLLLSPPPPLPGPFSHSLTLTPHRGPSPRTLDPHECANIRDGHAMRVVFRATHAAHQVPHEVDGVAFCVHKAMEKGGFAPLLDLPGPVALGSVAFW